MEWNTANNQEKSYSQKSLTWIYVYVTRKKVQEINSYSWIK